GLAEFVAAEEMDRQEGFWWSPDGDRLLVARVDVGPVNRWYIADPADPSRAPRQVAYPVAGSPNAVVTLLVAGAGGGSAVPVRWDSERFEYLVAAHWDAVALLIVVQSRDQRTMRVLEVSPQTGETRVIREDVDPDWVDIVGGVPRHLTDGSLVWTVDADDARRLLVDGTVVTPADLHVRGVLDVDGDTVLFSASSEPTNVEVWSWERGAGAVRLAPESGAGTFGARRSGATTVLAQRTLDSPAVSVTVIREQRMVAAVRSLAETPIVLPRVQQLRLGARELRAALLWPTGYAPGSGSLPVLLDPYGGPGHQRVVASQGPFLESQWFADQGFAVLVIDGRGTPGRGWAWERSIRGDRPYPVLDDQIDGLRAAAALHPDLDLSRVAIRGWSYGGFLSGLAVLSRPDVFHAAVAGAPNADQRLYDTHYTERFLGMPDEEPESYDRMSLALLAPKLERPLLLIHGLSDDNVIAAHTLRLAAALDAARRPHQLVLLSGFTHSTNRPSSANLLLLQLEFLKNALHLA
ncbi:MAG: prolyl oligopeptidase family serine peptidase, partial [Candidatus Dormibacteraeota bacterium]|nr:prolyl oligopeptidase family serine peptidase [Candidatus Dormibacteraeota bacterium]